MVAKLIFIPRKLFLASGRIATHCLISANAPVSSHRIYCSCHYSHRFVVKVRLGKWGWEGGKEMKHQWLKCNRTQGTPLVIFIRRVAHGKNRDTTNGYTHNMKKNIQKTYRHDNTTWQWPGVYLLHQYYNYYSPTSNLWFKAFPTSHCYNAGKRHTTCSDRVEWATNPDV